MTSLRSALRRVAGGLLALLVASLVLGQALGSPVGLSYAETGSMEPTIDAGDGFVAVPVQVDGSIEEGDVVVFEAEEIRGGGLVTHRVVGRTDRGFVTRGDANPFTDQDNGEPPVKRAQIVATALELNGHVVVVPHLGTVVEGTRSVLEVVQRTLAGLLGTRSLLGVQGLAYLLFAASLLWYALGEWRARDGGRHRRSRSRTTGIDSRLVVGAFATLLVAGATAAMVLPAGTHEYGVVSAEFGSERPTVIPAGESSDVSYPVDNGGVVPVVVFLAPASDGVDVRPRETYVGSRSAVDATVTLRAPPETGYYRRFVVEHRYLAALPRPTIRALHRIHPWLPIVVIDALLGGTFYLTGVGVVGAGRLRSRTRGGPSRLRRLLSRFT